MVSIQSTQKTGSIQNQLDSAHKQKVLGNRIYINQLIEIALYSISLSNVTIVAQSYDSANVMSGQFGGVQQKVKLKHPFAIYTPLHGAYSKFGCTRHVHNNKSMPK